MMNENIDTPSSSPTLNTSSPGYEDEYVTDTDFSYDGYQVVRGEFFSHIREPSVTFNKNKVTFNNACFKRLPNVEFIQLLVNMETFKMAVRPCQEDEKDSLPWGKIINGVRKSKPITCKIFFAKVISLMNWNPDYRYKIMGKLLSNGTEQLILFDLTCTETYIRVLQEGQKPKFSRKPTYPAEWQNQFGVPYVEHQTLTNVDVFDGYTVFGFSNETPSSENSTGGV